MIEKTLVLQALVEEAGVSKREIAELMEEGHVHSAEFYEAISTFTTLKHIACDKLKLTNREEFETAALVEANRL